MSADQDHRADRATVRTVMDPELKVALGFILLILTLMGGAFVQGPARSVLLLAFLYGLLLIISGIVSTVRRR